MDINSYSSAISSVVPGTFVPDMGTMAPKSVPIAPDDQSVAGAGDVTFKDQVKAFISDVNDKQVTADQMSMDLATGKTNDQEAVVKAVEKAGLAMQMTMSVRNKLMEAYTSIEQMQF